jgi:DNA-binding protein Fis
MRAPNRCFLLFILLSACHHASATDATGATGATDESQVLARMGKMTITAKDLQSRALRLAKAARDELPLAKTDFEKRMILLDHLLKEEALLDEAHRRGYDRLPRVVEDISNKMLEDEVLREDRAYPVAEADVARYYGDHLQELGRPALLRVLQIFTTDRAKAAEVLSKARAIGRSDLDAFQRLVSEYSEDSVTRIVGGDLGFIDARSTRVSKAVVDAAFVLRDLFDLSEPIATPQGFYVLKLVQRLPPYVPSIADAEPGIRAKLRWLLIERKKYALGKSILNRAAPDIDMPLLAKVPLPDGLFANAR